MWNWFRGRRAQARARGDAYALLIEENRRLRAALIRAEHRCAQLQQVIGVLTHTRDHADRDRREGFDGNSDSNRMV